MKLGDPTDRDSLPGEPIRSVDRDFVERLDRDGYAILPALIDPSTLQAIRNGLERPHEEAGTSPGAIRRKGEAVYGQRDLIGRFPEVDDLAHSSSLLDPVQAVLGVSAFPVRGLLFDKTEAANWGVPWHRDLMIAVRKRLEAPGYSGWSLKAGILHVQPPVAVLEGMLTIRIHLDDTPLGNAPLRVLPGSHRLDGADPTELEPWKSSIQAVDCVVNAGDAVLMRPLLLHASKPASLPSRRRVIHLEYASQSLPHGLQWNEFPRMNTD